VLAAPGYPENPRKGGLFSGLETAAALPDVTVLHAGTSSTERGLEVSGGRVLNVVGTGPDLATARAAAYRGAHAIEFEGKQMRMDIAGEGT
jgi:phosphoribosylamine--glycine ligase